MVGLKIGDAAARLGVAARHHRGAVADRGN